METGRLDPILIQGIIQAVYRLFRVGTFHSLENDAIDLAITATLNALRRLDAFESEGITLIFADDTCIVNGQLLQAPPDVYQSAMDFSEFLSQVKVNSITIGKGVASADLRKLLGLFVDAENASLHLEGGGFLTRHIRLRLVNPNLLLGLEDDRLSLLERVLLTYALAVLVIRRLFQSIEHGGFDLAGYFKRMARQLATVNYADRPVVLDVILAKHLEPDDAKLAVNSAILAVAMTRRFTDHESTLSRVCMSALLLDVGRHRPASKDDPDADLSVSTALIHMAMGDLRGDSVERTIVTFEAQRMLLGVAAGEIYSDGVEPTIDAHIIATARSFTELLSRGHGGAQIAADGAVEVLRRKATSDVAHMTLDLLVDAIGLIPRGAAVELNSGYRGVVLRAGPSPSKYDKPTVRLVVNNRGERVEPASIRLDADQESARQHTPVMRVINSPGALVRSVQRDVAGPFFEWVPRRKQSENNVHEWLGQQAKFAESAVELRRAGHTTSSNIVVGGDARKAAMDWDADAGQQMRTEVLKKSQAAIEFEYRHSREFDVVPDDFAQAAPQSSVRHRNVQLPSDTGVRRTVGTGVHRTANTGAHDVAELLTRTESIGAGAHSVSRTGSHRTAQTGSHDVSGIAAEPGARRSKGSGIYRRVETDSHELGEEFDESTRSGSVRLQGRSGSGSVPVLADTDTSGGHASARRPRQNSGAFDARPESGTSPTTAIGAGVFKGASSSGKRHFPGAGSSAPQPDAFDDASSSGILRRPTSGSHRVVSSDQEATSRSRSRSITGSERTVDEGLLSAAGPADAPASDSASQAGVLRRPSTGSARTAQDGQRSESASSPSGPRSESRFTAQPRGSVSGSPMSIKEHLAARKQTLSGPPSSADNLEEKPAPFAGVLRKRKTGSRTAVPSSASASASGSTSVRAPTSASAKPAVSGRSAASDTPSVPPLIVDSPTEDDGGGFGGAGILRRTSSRRAVQSEGRMDPRHTRTTPSALAAVPPDAERPRPRPPSLSETPPVPSVAVDARNRDEEDE